MKSTSMIWCALVSAVLVACGGAQQSQPPAAAPAAPAAAAPEPAAGADPAAAPAAAAPAPTRLGPNPTPDGVVFNWKPPGKYRRIFLAGSFNGWNPSNQQYLMKDEDGDGIFSITVKLAPGTHQYKYVADGSWIKDDAAPDSHPDGFGGQNGKFELK
jgi:hypothetical protein